jgi:hypothetical protein
VLNKQTGVGDIIVKNMFFTDSLLKKQNGKLGKAFHYFLSFQLKQFPFHDSFKKSG